MKFKIVFFTWIIIFSNPTIASQDYKLLSGVAKQGGFIVLQVAKGSLVEYKKKTIKADKKNRVLIAFSRDDSPKQQFKLITKAGDISFPTINIITRSYEEQRINGLPKNKVSPDKKTSDKIWADILKAKQARKINLPLAYFESGFIWPASGIVSGVYGSRRILNGQPKRPHYGIDIAAAKGTALYSPADGKITLQENMVLSGKTIMIDHGYGLRSTLMHLSEVSVNKADIVKKGQLVGKIGMTGRATGPHVHWGMSWHNIRLDPALTITKTIKKGDKVFR